MGDARYRWALAGVVLLAIGLRLAHVAAMSDDVFFDAPVIDARTNVTEAAYLSERSWLGPPAPFWKPPGYAYLLAIEQVVLGPSPWMPRLVQILLDALTCLLVAGIGRRLFGEITGLAAAGVLAISGPMIYFSGELVSATLAVFLDTLLLWYLVRNRDRSRLLIWTGAGALLGLAAVVRAEMLLFAPVVLTMAYCARTGPPLHRFAAPAVAAAGILAVVAPITVRNATVGNDTVLISANGGVNFYIGTAPEYRGMVGVRPGPEWERLMREPEARSIVTKGSKHSAFFLRRGLSRWASAPGRTLAHSLKKAVLFVHGYELASNRSLYEARTHSAVLSATVWSLPGVYFPFGLLMPFAALGIVLALRERHAARLLLWFPAILLATAMLFFVTARFRLPAVPVLALFAAFGGRWLVDQVRARTWRRLAAPGAVALVVFFVSNAGAVFRGDRIAYEKEMQAELHHYRGTVLWDVHGRPDDAAAELTRATELQPNRVSTWFNLAQVNRDRARPPETLEALRGVFHAAESSPGEHYFLRPAQEMMTSILWNDKQLAAEPFGRGVLCQTYSNWTCAVDAFREAGDDVFLARALFRRAETELDFGKPSHAARALAEAVELRPHDSHTRLLFALAKHRLRDTAAARAQVDEFVRLDWPRGSFYRIAVGRRRSQVDAARQRDIALLEMISEYRPDQKLAAGALHILNQSGD